MAGQGFAVFGDSMPTLIRLFLVLAFLAGLGFAGMIALTVMVDPGGNPTGAVLVRQPAGGTTAEPADAARWTPLGLLRDG